MYVDILYIKNFCTVLSIHTVGEILNAQAWKNRRKEKKNNQSKEHSKFMHFFTTTAMKIYLGENNLYQIAF